MAKEAPSGTLARVATLSVRARSGETAEQASARVGMEPAVGAGLLALNLNRAVAGLGLDEVVAELENQCSKVNAGDLSRAESLLTAQAHTLDALFNNFSVRALANVNEYLDTAEMYLRLALKAQSQCRATLETLGQLKNPGAVAFVRQANIANGPQQINNGTARAEKNVSQPNKLLEAADAGMESRTAVPPSLGHSPLETLAPFHRAKDAGRQAARGAQRLEGRRATAAARSAPSAAGPGTRAKRSAT